MCKLAVEYSDLFMITSVELGHRFANPIGGMVEVHDYLIKNVKFLNNFSNDLTVFWVSGADSMIGFYPLPDDIPYIHSLTVLIYFSVFFIH